MFSLFIEFIHSHILFPQIDAWKSTLVAVQDAEVISSIFRVLVWSCNRPETVQKMQICISLRLNLCCIC